MKSLFATAVLTGVLVLSGCATLSESQCLANDWQTVGYSDGLIGIQSSQLLKHQNACVKHGIVPDRPAYLVGWKEGVEQYCQPHNGFTTGERGVQYANVCPTRLKGAFYAAYQEGRQLYLARSEISTLQRSISQMEYQVKQIKTEIAEAEIHIIDGATTPIERHHLLEETKSLAQEQGKLETQIQNLRLEVAVKAERLENLRQVLALAAR
ncbi:MAG: DUF2799 domain-containing protein [Gammaproteobacteria bacterium]|nr:DUF2799 domain-containing protein [Gammaproteobacteria bacterium]